MRPVDNGPTGNKKCCYVMIKNEIIIFVPYLNAFGGVERLILSLSRYLNNKGLAHSIVCFSRTIDLASYAAWPVKICELRPDRNVLSEAYSVTRYFWKLREKTNAAPLFFDLKGALYAGLCRSLIYHLHLTDPPSVLISDISKCAPSLRKRALSFSNDESPGPIRKMRGELVHRLNSRGVKRAASVMVMTDAIARELESLYSRQPKVVRPGVMGPPENMRIKRLGVGNINILSVSRLEKTKRIDWILAAVAKLESCQPGIKMMCDWTLDIVGEGPQEAFLRDAAQQLGIDAKVRFHGGVTDREVEKIFGSADLFVMPAIQGYGLPALEALARGVPVILHRDSGVAEILHHSPWVEVIENAADDLAAAMRRMIRNIVSGSLSKHPIPRFPSDTEWAEEIAITCGWAAQTVRQG